MSLEISSKSPDQIVTIKTINNHEKNVRKTTDLTLECNGQDKGEGGMVSIRTTNHLFKVNLKKGSDIVIKDLGTEIRAK